MAKRRGTGPKADFTAQAALRDRELHEAQLQAAGLQAQAAQVVIDQRAEELAARAEDKAKAEAKAKKSNRWRIAGTAAVVLGICAMIGVNRWDAHQAEKRHEGENFVRPHTYDDPTTQPSVAGPDPGSFTAQLATPLGPLGNSAQDVQQAFSDKLMYSKFADAMRTEEVNNALLAQVKNPIKVNGRDVVKGDVTLVQKVKNGPFELLQEGETAPAGANTVHVGVENSKLKLDVMPGDGPKKSVEKILAPAFQGMLGLADTAVAKPQVRRPSGPGFGG